MADLSLQDASNGLGDITFTAAASGGDTMPSGIRFGAWSLPVVLLVSNGDTAAHTVTVDGHPQVSVPAGATGAVPVYGGGVYYGTRVPITYDAVTSVTVAAVRTTSAEA